MTTSPRSPWNAGVPSAATPPVEGNLITDVVIIGAGVTGLSTALRLAELGRGVVVLEARTIGSGASGATTAHVTEALDTRYARIEQTFGLEASQIVAESSRVAIERIADWCGALAIPGFKRLPGYLFSERADERDALAAEQAAAERAGARAQWDDDAPLSFAAKGAVRFDDQAELDMGAYLTGLARACIQRGARIYENSRVLAVGEDPCIVHLENGATVRARAAVFATHSPLNRLLLQTKIARYQSYVIAVSGARTTPALYWDTANPYHYLRTARIDGKPLLLIGGQDHKTGADDHNLDRFDRLETYARERFGEAIAVEHRWSGQILEPVDGLPLIGRNSASESVFVATGFAGNGITMGTVAALVLSDLILRKPSSWAQLYDATRINPIASAAAFVKENVDFPVHLIGDWLTPASVTSVAHIGRDEGKIVKLHGERLAVYRDVEGCLHATSAVCTHLGCLVKFNEVERSWDCPCHGSRFDVDGEVIEGPATRPLSRRHVSEAPKAPVVLGAERRRRIS